MLVLVSAGHHMRNHHDEIAIPSKMALDAYLGASDLAFDQHKEVVRTNIQYMLWM